jgi:hypothetical protein
MGETARKIAIVVAAAAIAVNLLMWARGPGSLPLLLKRVLVDGDKTPVYMNTAMDAFLDRELKGDDIALRFIGFRPLSREDETDVPLLIYERVVFHQYPNAVYAARDGRVVNFGDELIAPPFTPSSGWLAERGVDATLTIRRDPSGAIRTAVERIK